MLILALCVVLNGMLFIGLFRRTATVLESVERYLRAQGVEGLAIGSPLPDFHVTDDAGHIRESGGLHDGPFVLLFSEPTCEPCQVLMEELGGQASEEIPFPIFIVLDEETAQEPAQRPLAFPVLYQSGRQASQALKTGMRPDAYLIDATKKVAGRTIPNTVADLIELTSTKEVTAQG